MLPGAYLTLEVVVTQQRGEKKTLLTGSFSLSVPLEWQKKR